MEKGIQKKEPDPRIVYADIIDLPHHQSSTRPHMSLYDRAAQFSSYKALTGYEDMVAEEARVTEEKISLEEFELELLNQKLQLIADKRVDMAAQKIVLMSARESGMNNTIDFDKIVDIHGDLVDYLDDE